MAPLDRNAGLRPFGIGHNGGPPLDPGASWRHFCWKKAHTRAWKTPPREIALARLARAEALGINYSEYTAVLLDTGRHLVASMNGSLPPQGPQGMAISLLPGSARRNPS